MIFKRTKKYSQILKKMGFFRDQKGILNRYLRESENWNSHIKNTREAILHSAAKAKKDYVVILGSGWLLDVPIDELSQMFSHISLVDIKHPAQIKKKIEKHPHIELVEKDLTGGLIEKTYHMVQQYKKGKEIPLLRSLQPEKTEFNKDPDLLISCNTMTQLGILIKEYIKKQKIFSNSDIFEFEKIIQNNHLNLLKQHKSCLITEYEEEIYDEEGVLAGTNPLLFAAVPEDKIIKKWKWHFDTRMYYREDAKTSMNVLAVEI